VRWEVLEGPGEVAFEDVHAASTAASFSTPGDYVLRLVGDDGQLWLSDHVSVHVLEPGAAVARAWNFDKPLDKQGWSAAATGTRVMEFKDQPWPCVAQPVDYVGGGQYIVAIEQSGEAHLLSPPGLGVDLARHKTVRIRMHNHTLAARMRLRFATEGQSGWPDAQVKMFDVVPLDSGLRVYTVDMTGVPGWTGKLHQLRVDFATGEELTGTCRIDHVTIGTLR
jgi:hypothetical protein